MYDMYNICLCAYTVHISYKDVLRVCSKVDSDNQAINVIELTFSLE